MSEVTSESSCNEKSLFLVSAFYYFLPLASEECVRYQQELTKLAESVGVRGLIIVSPEGWNGTFAGSPDGVRVIENWLTELVSRQQGGAQVQDSINAETRHIRFQHSEAEFQPFRRLKVDLRPQALTYSELPLPTTKRNHLSPEEWDRVLEQEECALIDVRNSYEIKLGKFVGAIDPNTEVFTEFPKYVANCNLPKDKPVLMYCTGGIRCEKAIYEMEKQGFQKVYQLEGGILNYLKHHATVAQDGADPGSKFDGECFVFDHRVAVDGSLQPSRKYQLCPHCGQPGQEKISCKNCDSDTVVCELCLEKAERHSCSKNCCYHLARELADNARRQ